MYPAILTRFGFPLHFYPNYGIEGDKNPFLNVPCKPTILNQQKVQSQIFVNLALAVLGQNGGPFLGHFNSFRAIPTVCDHQF